VFPPGSIDGSSITDGTITGDKIVANSITADKVLIQPDDLIADPYFDTAPGVYWSSNGGGVSAGPGSAMQSTDMALPGHTYSNKLVANGGSIYAAYLAPGTGADRIPVIPGKSYQFEAYVYLTKADATGDVSLRAYWYDTSGTLHNQGVGYRPGSGNFPVAQWVRVAGTYTMPAGAVSVTPRLTVYTTSSDPTVIYYVGSQSVRNAADAELIVDGAIDGQTITGATLIGGTIETNGTAAGIVMTNGLIQFTDGSAGNPLGDLHSVGSSVILESDKSEHSEYSQVLLTTNTAVLGVFGPVPGAEISLNGTAGTVTLLAGASTTVSFADRINLSPNTDLTASAGGNIQFSADGTVYLTGNGSGGGTGDFQVGADSGAARVWSMAVYNRTYSSAANMVVTAQGTLGRSTSAKKYKIYVKKQDYADEVLALNPVMYNDRWEWEHTAKEDHPTLTRYPGLIAEDVAAAGLSQFVTYGEDGEPEGLMYDRLWTPLIPLVKTLWEDYLARHSN